MRVVLVGSAIARARLRSTLEDAAVEVVGEAAEARAVAGPGSRGYRLCGLCVTVTTTA
ncbi:MAG: hypothetical protein ACRD2T_14680 [Thermoanaerobaculia bacterium]